jgi:DNA-binding transcriptional MocR family regulator
LTIEIKTPLSMRCESWFNCVVLAAAQFDLAGLLDVRPTPTSPYLVGWLTPGVDDWAAAPSIVTVPISSFAIEPLVCGGLLLGFAAIDEPAIRDGVRRLAKALRPLVRS